MQAIPSEIPLSCTASRTSSVMSRTASPPAVRSWVSRWKTFTAPILRVPAAYVTGEPSISRHAAGRGRFPLGIHGRPAAGSPAHGDRSGHSLRLVAVDRAVHLVALARLERELDGLTRAGRDVSGLGLAPFAAARLDHERVGDRPLVGDVELIRARLRNGERARVDGVLLLGHPNRLQRTAAALAAASSAAVTAAAGGEQERRGDKSEQTLHDRDYGSRAPFGFPLYGVRPAGP